MTGITDDQCREVRSTARTILDKPYDHTAAACELASFVLATVDAPAPTLAEELRGQAEWARRIGAPCNAEKIDSFAARAEQMEHDLTEARAEVERLDAVAEDYARRATAALTERDESRAERDQVRSELAEVTNARDSLREEYDHASAEVERLTAERNSNGRAAQLERDGDAPSQVALDPADAKPGEAWTVECNGEKRTAVKDKDDPVPWNTITSGGVLASATNSEVKLLHQLVHAPRIVTDADELDRLADGSVVLDGAKLSCHKASSLKWRRCDGITLNSSQCLGRGPVTVLWEPEV